MSIDLKPRLIQLLQERSLRTGEFTLASGRKSNIYLDVRQTSLSPEGAFIIGRLLLERLLPDVEALGGPTLGADPIVAATAALSWTWGRPVPGFLVRKEAKGHGAGGFLVGVDHLRPGARVAVVEDTTTTGGSFLRAIAHTQAAGYEVVQCFCVVERGEGAQEAFEKAGLKLEYLLSIKELLP